MAGAVTYNGVESAEGGNIFAGKSFWVAARIPIRSTILNHIRRNGGKVELLEKNADLLIADHVRKDAPPGSYSWKFITDSVDNGIIQIKDRYRIGPDPDLPRPAGGGGLTKGKRTAFTRADDAELAKWALSHRVDRTGNRIYQDLAQQNPRHTWQSWRNRYVKTLMSLRPEQLDALASEAVDEPHQQSSSHDQERDPAAHHTTPSNVQTRTPQAAASSPAIPESSRPEPSHEKADTPAPEEETGEPGKEVMRDEFFGDLAVYMEVNGTEFPVHPVIGRQGVDLFDLAMAVDVQNTSVEDTDWSAVAADLGYTSAEAPTVMIDLRHFYERHLVEFLDATADFPAGDEEAQEIPDSYNDDLDSSAAATRQQPESPAGYFPSSPPMGISGKKRTFDETSPIPGHRAKRRRLSRDAEIPSTPDEKIGVVRSRQPPSAARDLEDTPSGPTSAASGLRNSRPPNGRQSPARLQSQQSAMDVTPSQQLQHELVDATPIPLDLDQGRRDQDTSSSEDDPFEEDPRASLSGFRRNGRATQSVTGSTIPATPSQTSRQKAVRRSLPISFQSQQPRKFLAPVASATRTSQPDNLRRAEQPEPDRGNGNQREILEWIEYYESLGYSHKNVVEALKRTTMTPGGQASHIMQSLQDGQGVPSHHEGIWTNRDDESLRLVDSIDPQAQPSNLQESRHRKKAQREWNRLVGKHGLERIELRRKFLEADAI